MIKVLMTLPVKIGFDGMSKQVLRIRLDLWELQMILTIIYKLWI